jgi:predicted CXXCH cytochrome family protein
LLFDELRTIQAATRLSSRREGCHSDLKTQDGQPGVAAKIRSFTDGHPEFAAVRTGQADPGGIKLNHKVHLKKDLRGPNGNVTLQCSDCHRPFGARGPSSYGRSAGFESIDQIRPQEGSRHFVVNAYMAPVNYYEHCSGCHPLDFDARIGEPAPHKPPAVVREFLTRMYTGYIQGHAGELRSPSIAPARVPRLAPEPTARNQADWVVSRVEVAERLLWAQACKLCHTPSSSPSGAAIPEVREARITTRWLPNGEFSHSAHAEVACTECHSQASSSERSSEILVPGIQVCRQCHNPQNTAAGTACFECHQYHDWSKEVVKAGSLRIQDVAPK